MKLPCEILRHFLQKTASRRWENEAFVRISFKNCTARSKCGHDVSLWVNEWWVSGWVSERVTVSKCGLLNVRTTDVCLLKTLWWIDKLFGVLLLLGLNCRMWWFGQQQKSLPFKLCLKSGGGVQDSVYRIHTSATCFQWSRQVFGISVLMCCVWSMVCRDNIHVLPTPTTCNIWVLNSSDLASIALRAGGILWTLLRYYCLWPDCDEQSSSKPDPTHKPECASRKSSAKQIIPTAL